MCHPPPEITDFFGVFLAYSDTMENSHLFGKLPLHWDPTKYRFVLDFKFSRDYKSLIRIGFSFMALIFPVVTILVAYLSKKFVFIEIFPHFKDIVPFDVVNLQVFILVILFGVFVIFFPVIFFWKNYTAGEMERSFVMFKRLSKGKRSSNFGIEYYLQGFNWPHIQRVFSQHRPNE